MTSQANIKIVLEAVNNAQKALQDVQNQLQGVGNEAEATSKKTGLLGTAFGNLGGIVAGFAGAAGLGKMIGEATESDKSFVRMSLSMNRYSDALKNSLIPQVQQGAKAIQAMGIGSDELAQETIARLLPTFKNDLPKAINGASTLLTLMKYDVRGASTVLNFLGEDSDFATVAMGKLAKAVGIDVNPKMDDLGEILERVRQRLQNIELPPFVQELGKLIEQVGEIFEKVGTKILKIITPVLAAMNKLMELPVVGVILEWVFAVGAVALALGGMLKTLGLMPAVTAGAKAAWAALSAIFMGTGAVSLATVGWIALIAAALIGIGYLIYKAITDWEGFKRTVQIVWNTVKEVIVSTLEFIGKVVVASIDFLIKGFNMLADKTLFAIGYMVGSIIKFFKIDLPNGISWFVTAFLPAFITTIVTWFQNLPQMIATALASLPSIFASIFNNARNIIASILQDIWNWVSELPQRLLDSIRTGINFVIDKINSFVSGFNQAVPKGLEIKNIPHLAEGGIVTRPTIAMIGERGAEAVLPLNRLAGAGGGGYTINIDFSGSVLLSERAAVEIGDKIIDRLRKTIRIPSRSF